MTPPAPTPEEMALAALKRCQEEHGPEAWLCYDCLCRLFLSHGHALATAHARGREDMLRVIEMADQEASIIHDLVRSSTAAPADFDAAIWRIHDLLRPAIRALRRPQGETR